MPSPQVPKQWRVTVTIDKDLYSYLENRAKKEARTIASLGKYLLLKGLESEGQAIGEEKEKENAA